MGADPDDVSAQEDQDVSTYLERKGRRAGLAFTHGLFHTGFIIVIAVDFFFLHSRVDFNSCGNARVEVPQRES